LDEINWRLFRRQFVGKRMLQSVRMNALQNAGVPSLMSTRFGRHQPVHGPSKSPADKSRLRLSTFEIDCSSYMPRENAITLLAISARFTRAKRVLQRCSSR
jgi:hypothetical protein